MEKLNWDVQNPVNYIDINVDSLSKITDTPIDIGNGQQVILQWHPQDQTFTAV